MRVRLRRKSVSDIIVKERYNILRGTPSFRCQYRVRHCTERKYRRA